MSIQRPAPKRKGAAWILLVIVILISITGVVYYLRADKADKELASHKQHGNEYLMQDNYLGAKEEFGKAIKLEPRNLVIYFQLAEACIGLEDYPTAAGYLEQAIAIAEEEPMNREQYEALVIKLVECYDIIGEDSKREDLVEHSLERIDSERIRELLGGQYQ